MGRENIVTTQQPVEETRQTGEKPPIEVFLTTPTLLTGGAEKFVTELAVRFDPARFRVSVLVTRGQTDPAHLKLLADAGIEVIIVGGKTRAHSILACARVIALRRPDVLHTNIGSLLHVSLGALLLPKSAVKVHTLHSMAGHAEPGRRLDITKRLMHRLNFTPISISNAVRDSAAAAFDIPAEAIPLIPNGVDTKRFAPPQNNQRHVSEETRFVAVGSLLPVKQHENLIAAFARMEPRLQQQSKLTIVGGGPLHDDLQALIDTLGVSERVSLLGNQKDVPGILKSHDVFVSASRTEGFPLSLLEGLAAGLPAAVTAVDGVTDIVRDGVEGLLVTPKDVDSMRQAMEQFVSDQTLRSVLGAQARQRAEYFSWERCIDSYAELYLGTEHRS